ncbi:MBL fold metallo-hydrolase [Paroceanicella profunda]|uniref:MBL fold metallo-hydrolase n=1 Tax=Paroceanicella profunda TaxID=2579971 RepID=A0A5B8FXE0_9RHOB|nr:MBL fold metallo-hydrolase [Paroceanicella profunda]QDL90763.1 MBL fold metallo-hydrolase [Paroceanicella profunda]
MPSPFITDHRPVHGVIERLAPGVRVITAPNAGPMTFTGTRSYLVGEGDVALIDPGPDDPAHFEALCAVLAAGERISHILVTHSHSDHSPLAARMRARTGAPVFGFGPHGAGMSAQMQALAASGAELGGGEGADHGFAPDIALGEGDRVSGSGWALTALHTPGHLSNHLSFALEGEGALFSGDHVMGWATTLVSPPEGDLAAFMTSLRRLQERDDRVYYPGHGAPVAEPAALVAHVLSHRQQREAQIRAALERGPATPAVLAERIYSGLDARLLPAARRNVLAHLLDLVQRGLVAPEGEMSAGAVFRRA